MGWWSIVGSRSVGEALAIGSVVGSWWVGGGLSVNGDLSVVSGFAIHLSKESYK